MQVNDVGVLHKGRPENIIAGIGEREQCIADVCSMRIDVLLLNGHFQKKRIRIRFLFLSNS